MGERWFSTRALKLHVALMVVVPGCLVAGWWQLHQALGGNGLSWAYTFEWPCFAVIATVAWWHLIHESAAQREARLRPVAPAQAGITGGDEVAGFAGPELPGRVAEAARRELELHLRRLAEDAAPAPRRPSQAT